MHPSPSNLTNAGKKILGENPDSPGSLGIAISEAVEDAATHEDTKYSLGSVLNHVYCIKPSSDSKPKNSLNLPVRNLMCLSGV